MDKVYQKIANILAQSLNKPHEEEIYLYALRHLGQFIIVLICLILISLPLGILKSSLIILFSNMVFRSFSGGNHFKYSSHCTIISISFISLFALIATQNNIDNPVLQMFEFIVFVLGIFIVKKYAPRDNPNRLIFDFDEIKRLKKLSFLYILLYGIIGLFQPNFINADYYFAVTLGICWQLFTLTPVSKKIMNIIDYIGETIW